MDWKSRSVHVQYSCRWKNRIYENIIVWSKNFQHLPYQIVIEDWCIIAHKTDPNESHTASMMMMMKPRAGIIHCMLKPLSYGLWDMQLTGSIKRKIQTNHKNRLGTLSVCFDVLVSFPIIQKGRGILSMSCLTNHILKLFFRYGVYGFSQQISIHWIDIEKPNWKKWPQ